MRYASRVTVVAALAWGSIVAGCTGRPGPAQSLASALADPVPQVLVSTQTASAEAPPAPAAPVTPAPAAPMDPARTPKAPIGLPRVRDYEPIPDLRDIHFDFGMAVIRPDDARILDANAAWLRANPDQLVLIEGHCDNRGLTSKKNEFNMALGERRAEAAMNYLVLRGVLPSRITVLSYGEERPVCTEQNEQCWARNRRSRFLVKRR